MRSSKKRKFIGPMKPVNVMVSAAAREKLDRMAGPASLGYMVETLIEREHSRREKKLSLQVSEKPLKNPFIM